MWCIYIHVCSVSCDVVLMFTCTLVRSHPDSKRTLGWNLNRCCKQLDTRMGVATRCMLIRRGLNGVQSMPKTRQWRTYSRGASRRRLFKYVHWLLCIIVLYLHVSTFMICLFDNSVFGYLFLLFLHLRDLIRNIDWCLFSQLKINHDVHEFKLDSGTVANKYEV